MDDRQLYKDLLPILSAFVEGKKIEQKTSDGIGWMPFDAENFNLYKEYRVKPKTREMWMNVYETTAYMYSTKEEANYYASDTRQARIKLTIEEGRYDE